MKPDIFFYKLTVDNGGAPCVFNDVLSLAICKPKIRKAAKVGSWIFGFGGRKYNEKLIYIAKITEKICKNTYYVHKKWSGRPDRIYKDVRGNPVLRKTAKYHTRTDERKKDVGLRFEGAFVLISENFRYFGNVGDVKYKEIYPAINSAISNLEIGHRRNLSLELRGELLKLKTRIWRQYKKGSACRLTEVVPKLLCNSGSRVFRC